MVKKVLKCDNYLIALENLSKSIVLQDREWLKLLTIISPEYPGQCTVYTPCKICGNIGKI